MIEVLANAMIATYCNIHVPDQDVVHLKLTQCCISNISHEKRLKKMDGFRNHRFNIYFWYTRKLNIFRLTEKIEKDAYLLHLCTLPRNCSTALYFWVSTIKKL